MVQSFLKKSWNCPKWFNMDWYGSKGVLYFSGYKPQIPGYLYQEKQCMTRLKTSAYIEHR